MVNLIGNKHNMFGENYQPMTAKAVMSSHKPIRIYYGEFNTRRYTLIQGFASLSCFLWLVKSYQFMDYLIHDAQA